MSNPQKQEKSAILREDILKSDCILVLNYRGINANLLTGLRKKFRENGGKMVVAKNTIMSFAAKGTKFECIEPLLAEESAFIIALKDPVLCAKTLVDFVQENANFKIKGGVLSGKMLDVKQIEALSKLPNREQMLAHLLATMNAPISGFVNVLAGTIRQVMNVLNAIKEQKEKA